MVAGVDLPVHHSNLTTQTYSACSPPATGITRASPHSAGVYAPARGVGDSVPTLILVPTGREFMDCDCGDRAGTNMYDGYNTIVAEPVAVGR